MADNNPNNPDSQGGEKNDNLNGDQSTSERAFIQAEQGRNLPLERDRLLEQIEDEKKGEGKENSEKNEEDNEKPRKKRRRRRRKKRPQQEKESQSEQKAEKKSEKKPEEKVEKEKDPEKTSQEDESANNAEESSGKKRNPEEQQPQEVSENLKKDAESEDQKPKRKRRRRRRRKKKKEKVVDNKAESEKVEDKGAVQQPKEKPEKAGLDSKSQSEEKSKQNEKVSESEPHQKSDVEVESESKTEQPESKGEQEVEEQEEPEVKIESEQESQTEAQQEVGFHQGGFTGPDIEMEPFDLEEKQPKTEQAPESEPEIQSEPKPEVETEPVQVPEPEAQPEQEQASGLEPEVKSEPELQSESKIEQTPEPEVQNEPKMEPEPESESEIQPELEVQPEQEQTPDTEPESQPFGQPPQPQVEADLHEEQGEQEPPTPQPGFENPYEHHNEDQENQRVDDQETLGKPTVSEAEIIPRGDEKVEVLPENDGLEVRQDDEVKESQEETPEEVQKKIDEKKSELGLESGELEEKKGIGASIRSVLDEVSPILGKVFNLRLLIGIIITILIIAGGWWAYSSSFFGLFDGGGGGVSGPTETSDPALMREYGLETGALFGMNDGSVSDRLSASIRAADFFGTLSEPAISGETGISAASFYGELMDEREIDNQFIEYVRALETLQNLYSIDVYGLLNQTTERETALANYIQQLQDAYEEGSRTLAAIRLNIDDLTISFNSISGQKDTFETDFFDALEGLEAGRSDALLKSFVDVSQKEVALRARVAALEKLVEFYETALRKLDERRNAVESNVPALVQGVRVIEVPGASELDLIIQP